MASLPSYLTSAMPVPLADRASWSRNVMPVYFTVVIWFVFWQDMNVAGIREYGPPGGMIASGFLAPFLGIAIAAAMCHFLFYMAPAQLGMRTGLPLTILASSTYGAHGGRFLPGLLVGLLQFGWVAVLAWFAGNVVSERMHWAAGGNDIALVIREWPRGIVIILFTIIATLIGMKGMRCVARTAAFLLLIPIAVLLLLFIVGCSGLHDFYLTKLVAGIPPDSLAVDPESGPMGDWQIVGVLCVYVTSYFAMFGLCGADVATNCRGNNDVHAGGVFGIFMPLIMVGELTMMIVAGMYGGGFVRPEHHGIYNPLLLMPDLFQAKFGDPWGMRLSDAAMIALALSSVAVAGFSSMLAVNSLHAAIPRIHAPTFAGAGAAVTAFLAFTGVAGCGREIIPFLGAAIAPICGAMTADYLMSGQRWLGPRAGLNPAGWISWLVGFAAGSFNYAVDLMLQWNWAKDAFPRLSAYQNYILVPPITAYFIGFGLYVGLSVVGLRTRRLLTPEGQLI